MPRAVEVTAMDDLLTVEEVCRRLGVSADTWYKWRARRITPKLIRLPNGSYRVRTKDLAAWLEAREAR